LRLLAGIVTVLVAVLVGLLYTTYARARFDKRVSQVKLSLEVGDLAAARDELLHLHASDDANPEVIELLADLETRRSDFAAAIAWLRRVPDSAADRASVARYRAAQLAMQVGQLRAAEELALEAIRLEPHFTESRRLLVRLYFLLFQQRKLHVQTALLDQSDEMMLTDLAMRCLAHRHVWDGQQHFELLEQGLRTDPDYPVLRAALACYYREGDRYVVARRVLNDASPGATDAWWILLGRVEDLVERGKFREAHDVLAELPPAADSECRVWLARGKVWSELGVREAALVAFSNAAKLDPYDPMSTYATAQLLLRHGESAPAEELLERSQLQQELMRLMRLLIESTNPSFVPVEPIEKTIRSAVEVCGKLGMDREATILAKTLTESGAELDQHLLRVTDNSEPLTFCALEDLTAIDQHQLPPASAGFATEVATAGVTPRTTLSFSDISQQVGLSFSYDTGHSPYRWIMETLGSGVAVMDFDLDGWPDIHFTQGCPLPVGAGPRGDSNRLFRNVDGTEARDVTMQAHLAHYGYGQGCAVGDYDNDGFPDLVVCNYGEIVLFRNNGDGTFVNATTESGVASSKWSTSAAFSDVDRDGDLDLYVVHYVKAAFDELKPCGDERGYDACRPCDYEAEEDVFWENLGNGRFADRTTATGLAGRPGKGLGVVFADLERRGAESIFVANDMTANSWFEPISQSPNDNSVFRESGLISGLAVNGQGDSEACMGIACGDVDGDGMFELFVTNFHGETNTLYKSLGEGQFADHTERTGFAGASRNLIGWGCQFIDIDCDMNLDLFVANGHLHETGQLPNLFYNDGSGHFSDVSKQAGDYFRRPRLGRSVALVDWNRDLLSDLVVTYQEGNVSLLENQSEAGHAAALKLVGSVSNRDAVGTRVRVRIGDRESHFQVSHGGGYFAANESALLVGCGAAERIDELEIHWPSGAVANWRDVKTERNYLVVEGSDRLWEFD
jgi:tetratricopeptide (TPR) repeat protein